MLVIMLMVGAGAYLFYDYKRFLQTPMVTENSPDIFAVESGDTLLALIKDFDKHHMPLAKKSPFSQQLGQYYFHYLVQTNENAHQLQIGDYQLQKGMTPPELLNLLTSGKTIAYTIQFIEGKTFKQLRQVLTGNPHLDHTLLSVGDKHIMATLGETNITHPEGMFFPDTYQFSNHTKDIKILQQSYELMQRNLADAWGTRDKTIQLKNPYELLILASIIEKETGIDGERQKISGVFHRRLAKNMPLQTDPSVIYGMGDQYKGTIYKSDLQRDTPYNTYTRKGLPPTPIAMPGKESLMAAGHPDKGKSLYFVADGKGGHVFSETYQQHLKAVKIYRQSQKNKP